jgi:hypothetical protein
MAKNKAKMGKPGPTTDKKPKGQKFPSNGSAKMGKGGKGKKGAC